MSRTVTPILVIGMALVAQALAIPSLWGHRSTEGAFLGQYSARYAVILIAHIIFSAIWLVTFALHRRVIVWIGEQPRVLVVLAISALGILAFVLWFVPVEQQIKQYVALNWLLYSILILICWRDGTALINPLVLTSIAVVVCIIVVLSLFTVITTFPFSPDEAHWADYASTAIQHGGLYARTWLMTPETISPGLGWSVAAYGWALEHIAFDIRMGRLWNFAGYLLAFGGIWLLTLRLYGRKAAFVSTAFAALSQAFIPVMDYRPDHQLVFASVFVVLSAVIARQSEKPSIRNAAHAICGLLATLSLQLHAAGIAFAVGMSLFYAIEWLLSARRGRFLNTVLWFGLGALIGTGIFYAANVIPAGGLTSYLAAIQSRTERLRALQFFTWTSLLETVVLVSAFGYIGWRRNASDRLYLGIVACIIVALALFDTQGYRSPVISLYVLVVGTLIIDGFRATALPVDGKWYMPLAAFCLIAVMAAQGLSFVNWTALRQSLTSGELPEYAYAELADALAPYVHDDDILVSTHLLIWTFPHHPNLVSVAAELNAMNNWGLSNGVEVWERISPTVIVDIRDQMTIQESLQTYMHNHNFQICHSLTLRDLDVTVYRPLCEEAA